ncbi:MAG: helix-turn-helix transcriptional regulator [Firmicutes bacterium]|nr:helix-turn-helix transcriptional regulator [Bacillota bacterium]
MTRLVVLGLLSRRPMHGYEIQQMLQVTQSERWANILPGSIYHALRKLEEEGLVEVQATERTGHRTRAVYRITEAGRQEYRRLLAAAWAEPTVALPRDLYLVLGFLDDLPRTEVLAAIERRIAALEAELAAWNAGEAAKEEALRAQGASLPPYLKAVFANGRAHLEADLQLLRYLREVLPTLPPVVLPEPPVSQPVSGREHESEGERDGDPD